jgi:hypothetical protein
MTRQSGPFRQLADQFLKEAETALLDRPVTAALAGDFTDWLAKRATPGDQFARAALDRMRQEGAEKWIKEALARRVGWVDAESGQRLAGRTRAGTPMRDENGARIGGFQQVLFRRMTRREFEDWVAMMRANRDSLSASIAFGNRVLRAWDEHPQIEALDELCTVAGIDLPDELRGEQTA